VPPAAALMPDFKNAPYWWDAAPPVPAPHQALPVSADVIIVGAGLTGLNAALPLARAGRHVVVLDREDIGFCASRRNAGYLGRTFKKSFRALAAAKGAEHATAVYRELDAALRTVLGVVADEKIDCHAVRCGRFIGANAPRHYEEMAREYDTIHRNLGFEFHMVPRSEQHAELATDLYHGGVVLPDLGSIHPGLYHRGLTERARCAGVAIHGRTEVLGLDTETDGVRVKTARGVLTARDVIIATNGYTPKHFPWHARRVIPFTGYMAATEILSDNLFKTLIPHRRTVLDSNMNIDFVRPAPDSARILVGGSTGSRLAGPDAIGDRLRRILRRILPQLAEVRFSHVWSGQCAATFDMMPHLGRDGHVWFGLGYNFAGLPMGTYFGRKIAQQILGQADGKTIFAETPMPTMPLYTGSPWFVPYVMRYFDWRDRRAAG
jgi:glycine/D-amino acid oxidase-like deaminating enzyme